MTHSLHLAEVVVVDGQEVHHVIPPHVVVDCCEQEVEDVSHAGSEASPSNIKDRKKVVENKCVPRYVYGMYT